MNFNSITSPARTVPGTRCTKARCRAGFSLLEMTIVVALLMIFGTLVLLQAQKVIRSVHLQTTGANLSNLLQQTRVRAIQDDKYYSLKTVTGSGGTPSSAFIDINQSGSFSSGDIELVFSSDVKPVTRSAAQSCCNVTSLESQFLPAGNNATINPSGAEGPTFGPRGLPCNPSALSGGTCPFLTTAIAYEIFLKNTRSVTYEAITITPAGRIRQWSYDGAGTWQPMN